MVGKLHGYCPPLSPVHDCYNLAVRLYYFCSATMDYDNDKEIQSSAVSKTDNTSVVRRRSRSTPTRHRHTSPSPYFHHEEQSGDDLPASSPSRREQLEHLAGLGASPTFRGFIAAPDVIFDEPFAVPSKPLFRKLHEPIPVHPSPAITARHNGSSSPLVTSGRLGLLPCQPPNVMRSVSDESTSSSQFAGNATLVIDTGHNGLIPSIGTTNKFTHKWPTPKSLGYESQLKKFKDTRSAGLHLNQSPASALEDGQGLGSGHVARWTAFKWCLLLSVTTVFVYGSAGLICALMTWFKTWDKAIVMGVADGDLLILITWAASMLLFTALLGMTGAFLNSRPILAAYTTLLWPAFISLLSVGYVAYKRDTLSLDHKLNLSWSRYYGPLGRLMIQDSLQCCGFYSPLHAASPSKRCYLRTPLPGCKGNLYNFEHQNLSRIWTVAFALVPLHMINLVVALLCANHMTNTFGKGITPKQYRLSATDVKADADKILDNVGLFFRPHAPKASPATSLFKDDKGGLIRPI